MRCLTLADELTKRGAHCTFVCRPHTGDLLKLIAQRGHAAFALFEAQANFVAPAEPAHAEWLGASLTDDAEQTRQALSGQTIDWLVVDHYALDQRWEKSLRDMTRKIMVIDDLADRTHDCDLLLDQTYGRPIEDYLPLVPQSCQLLCGSEFALLRQEFAALREYSLKRRAKPALKELLITMGGVDKDNVTCAVLNALRTCSLPEDCRLTVVVGQAAPWLQEVKQLASAMPRPTRVLAGIDDMAQIMADSDLAIGAAGATSWERCCLGLPSIMLVIADNQVNVANALEQVGAALLCLPDSGLQTQLDLILRMFGSSTEKLSNMSNAAASVVDGGGLYSVLKLMSA